MTDSSSSTTTTAARVELAGRLDDVLAGVGTAAIALSGGVDSMTLAYVAHRALGPAATMFHAASAAVPTAATRRVEAYAARFGWPLRIVDAGEFADEHYLANPSNRCFFCKTDLYGTLASHTGAQLLSGTNLDDLDDWRPSLAAAKDHRVRHPFVEAGFAKSDVRAVAAMHGLTDLAELPAAPCLSSRIETGLRIVPGTLRTVDRVETLLQEELSPSAVRCRVRRTGVVVELDPATLSRLSGARRGRLSAQIGEIFGTGQPVEFQGYARGSAFLREEHA